jgi:hypothetical protein
VKWYVSLAGVSVSKEITNAGNFCISCEQAFQRSWWFTQGWTLRKLLAPASVDFFTQDGKCSSSRVSLEQDIHEFTGISIEALKGQKLAEFSVKVRISWTAGRTTTINENNVFAC